MNPGKPIIILGSGGLLGRHVVREYDGHPTVALTHAGLDITNEKAVCEVLDQVQPDVVINCAALCHFQRCEEEPGLSEQINRDAPIRLAGLTEQRGIRLVHFSTDYIFDGKSKRPYREEDPANPLCVYGHHKAAVENAFAEYPQHLLLRVAWLFGKEGKTFLSMLPDLLMERDTLQVAAGKKGTCLHAGFAAKVIRQLVEQGSTGLFNLVHSGEMSWEGFAAECLRQLVDRGLEPRCQTLVELPLGEIAALRGTRPIYSTLDITRLSGELGKIPCDWKEGLDQFLDSLYPASRTTLA